MIRSKGMTPSNPSNSRFRTASSNWLRSTEICFTSRFSCSSPSRHVRGERIEGTAEPLDRIGEIKTAGALERVRQRERGDGAERVGRGMHTCSGSIDAARRQRYRNITKFRDFVKPGVSVSRHFDGLKSTAGVADYRFLGDQ